MLKNLLKKFLYHFFGIANGYVNDFLNQGRAITGNYYSTLLTSLQENFVEKVKVLKVLVI